MALCSTIHDREMGGKENRRNCGSEVRCVGTDAPEQRHDDNDEKMYDLTFLTSTLTARHAGRCASAYSLGVSFG